MAEVEEAALWLHQRLKHSVCAIINSFSDTHNQKFWKYVFPVHCFLYTNPASYFIQGLMVDHYYCCAWKSSWNPQGGTHVNVVYSWRGTSIWCVSDNISCMHCLGFNFSKVLPYLTHYLKKQYLLSYIVAIVSCKHVAVSCQYKRHLYVETFAYCTQNWICF